ncbi:MAG: ribose 5-phosphate isomerase B [Rhodothermales bacterium]
MAGRTVISERDVRDAKAEGRSVLSVPAHAIVTPLAADTARSLGIVLQPASQPVQDPESARSSDNPVVCIGSDHGGYAMKGEILKKLENDGYQVIDVGTDSPKACDYPDFAYAVARLVADGKAGRGIMIDGVGVGSAIACNKVPGVRAACGYTEFAAWNARAHNDANVLTLGSRAMGIEVVHRIVEVFLTSDFEGGRHEKRVRKMLDIEERFQRR